MPTTRQRLNLTLTEAEQSFLEAIVTEDTSESEFYARYLDSRFGPLSGAPPTRRSMADVVHAVLRLGMECLEEEAAEISYAAEAAAQTDEDRAAAMALSRRFIAMAAREDR